MCAVNQETGFFARNLHWTGTMAFPHWSKPMGAQWNGLASLRQRRTSNGNAMTRAKI